MASRARSVRSSVPLGPADPVDRLPGIGAAARSSLAEEGITTVADLVWLAPIGWDDLRDPPLLRDALSAGPGHVVASAVVKASGIIPLGRRRAVRVVLADPR